MPLTLQKFLLFRGPHPLGSSHHGGVKSVPSFAHTCAFLVPELGIPGSKNDTPPIPAVTGLQGEQGGLPYRTGLFTYRFRLRTFQKQRQKALFCKLCRFQNI